MNRYLPLAICCAATLGCSSKRRARDDTAAKPPIDDMVKVPSGWFSSGCYRLLATDEKTKKESPQVTDTMRLWRCVESEPPRRLWLSSFEIDRFEVTRADYEQCLKARACERRAPPTWERIHGDQPDFPAIATYDDASSYCRWRGKRLPTNAEWEKAARGVDDRIYPWGDDRPSCKQTTSFDVERDGSWLNTMRDCGEDTPQPVGRHPSGASPFGTQDMIDNAREWVSDWYVPRVAETESNGLDRNWNPIGDGPHFKYSTNTTKVDRILEYDWSSLEFVWKDAAVIDPRGPAEPSTPGPHRHAIKGDPFGIAGTSDAGHMRDDTYREYAGVRCVRAISGAGATSVQAPAPGLKALPFREPGYVPPGTREAGEKQDATRKD